MTRGGKHDCAYCGQTFSRISEHMIHVVEKHDPATSPPLRRGVSCWRCATEMRADERGKYACACGFILPDRETLRNAGTVAPSEKTDCSWASLK